MRSSRYVAILALVVIALVAGGAILGALLPKYVIAYTATMLISIAILALAWFFYTGHEKEAKKHNS